MYDGVNVSYEQLDVSNLAEGDVDAITALEASLFGAGAWSRQSVLIELTAPDRTYFVARDSKSHSIVGYAGFWFDGDDVEIMTIGVSKDYQGRHIATMLMNLMRRAAIEIGAKRMLLEVAVNNEPALVLYNHTGFEQIGLRKRYYQPENVDAYTMACTLPDGGRQSSGYAEKTENPVGFSIK